MTVYIRFIYLTNEELHPTFEMLTKLIRENNSHINSHFWGQNKDFSQYRPPSLKHKRERSVLRFLIYFVKYFGDPRLRSSIFHYHQNRLKSSRIPSSDGHELTPDFWWRSQLRRGYIGMAKIALRDCTSGIKDLFPGRHDPHIPGRQRKSNNR